VRNLYGHHFALKPGTRVYVPTADGRVRGGEIKGAIEEVWTPPSYYFHLQPGGHVAAVRQHHAAPWVASLDLKRFFDHISRARVHRAMKKLNFSQDDAWEIACDSVVDKHPPKRRFSIPFGFVQSPIIASVVLSKSALGRALRDCRASGVTVTVYVDDISLSADSEQALQEAIDKLDDAAVVSGFQFNPDKTQGPARSARSFNIQFGSGEMRILPDRLAEFEVTLRTANEAKIGGILGYVGSVSDESLDDLEALVGP
jgi:hypothetical protein